MLRYQINRSNWPESSILYKYVSTRVSTVIVMVTDCYLFVSKICIKCTCIDFVFLFCNSWYTAVKVIRRCCWAKLVCLCLSYVQSGRIPWARSVTTISPAKWLYDHHATYTYQTSVIFDDCFIIQILRPATWVSYNAVPLKLLQAWQVGVPSRGLWGDGIL